MSDEIVAERLDIEGAAGSLETWLAAPTRIPDNGRPAVVIVPGFPADAGGGANSFRTYPQLAERIATDARMLSLAVAFRGVSHSDGHFSLGGWRADLRTALAHIRSLDGFDGSLWILGFGTGGALAVQVAADDGDVAGVVAIAAPADFTDWASRPRELLSHARRCGAISDPAFPGDFDHWSKELGTVAAVKAARQLGENGTKLMVLHGASDDAVPPLDARAIADAHGAAELRIIDGARHHLRHDPRAVATAIGFLDRRGRAQELPSGTL